MDYNLSQELSDLLALSLSLYNNEEEKKLYDDAAKIRRNLGGIPRVLNLELFTKVTNVIREHFNGQTE